MEHDFWQDRWSSGRTKFHQPQGHPALPDLLARFPTGRALVPLSGKSIDLVTLHGGGYDVVGVEFVEQAVREFSDEQPQLELNAHNGPLGLELQGSRFRLLAADFFQVNPAVVGHFDLMYDRAALVALPPHQRPAYVDHLRTLLGPGGEILLFTFEYEQSAMSGPPFSVPPSEVESLYRGATIEHLRTKDVLSFIPHLATHLDSLVEHGFRITEAATSVSRTSG